MVLPALAACLSLFMPGTAGAGVSEGRMKTGPAAAAPAGALAGGLRRGIDPVFLRGEWLPSCLGMRLDRLRVYKFSQGRFVPIRFQVDERTPDGDWVFPHGKKCNAKKGNGLLDPQDVVMFMAKDAGGPCAPGVRPADAPRLVEVGVRDPVDGRKQWVYLAVHHDAGQPRCPLPDYVIYDSVRETITTACMHDEYLITEDGLHSGVTQYHATPPEAGGTGQNLLDRLKVRGHFRFFFGLIPLSLHEEMIGSEVVAYTKGPIRVLRRCEQFVKLPFGVRGMKGFVDIEVYEGMSKSPIEIQVPRGISRIVSSILFRFGVDYSPKVIGSCFRNSENPDLLIIDGRMSPSEKHVSERMDNWRAFYGPYGFLMTRFVFPPGLLKMIDIRQKYQDDFRAALPPERYPGAMGFAYSELVPTVIRSASYRFSIDMYYPAHLLPGGEGPYLRFRDSPLRIDAGGQEYENPVDIIGEAAEDF